MDIDIDFANRDQILSTLDHTVAVLKNNKKHNTGIYVTEIPKDPVTNYCPRCIVSMALKALP